MSRTSLHPLRMLLSLGLFLALTATVHAADRPLTEEERESSGEPPVVQTLPAGWRLGDAVTFPRHLLPVFQTPWRPKVVEPEPEEPTGVLAPFGVLHPTPAPFASVNTVANDTTGDHAAGTQSENTIVAFGRFVVAGWNDSFDPGGPRSFSGYGYSVDGGRTWKDGGILPHGTDDQLLGDPSLAVDAKGNVYYAQLYARPGVALAVAVSRGRFMNDVLVFEKASVAALPTGRGQLDKEWIAVDKRTGMLYVSYTNFLESGGNQIEIVRSSDQGQTWTAPFVLSDVAAESVQGSRPAVGPNGELYVVYTVTDLTNFTDHMRILRSDDHGRSFGPRVNIGERAGSAGLSTNFVSGPPGFNRGFGVEFPSIAVNHGGERKGTVYVAWNEAVDWQADPLGGAGVVAEVEGNNSAAQANAITLGQTVTGSYGSTTDLDFFSFTGHRGETAVFFLTPAPGQRAEGFLRLFGPGGLTANRLALSALGGGQAAVVFTLPSDGTYFIRPAIQNSQARQGPYLLFTGVHTPRATDIARDSRDVMVSSSRDGLHWTERMVANDAAPRYDEAFAEVATDRQGRVHLVWYDHHEDAANGVLSGLWTTMSRDGGRSWAPSRKVNDGPGINWSNVPSRLAPNMGDYISLSSDGDNVYALWADGRQGTPDSWSMKLASGRADDDDMDDDDDRESASRVAAGGEGAALALRAASPTRAGATLVFTLDLPEAGAASLELFSVSGQRVRTVASGTFAAGRHTLTWDALGRDGSPVAPGLYFAVLQHGGQRVQQRVVRIR